MLEIHKSHQNKTKILYFVGGNWKIYCFFEIKVFCSFKTKFSLSGIPVIILSTYWKRYFISNALLYSVKLYLCFSLATHIYFHSLHREDLDRGRLVRHEPVELVPALSMKP